MSLRIPRSQVLVIHREAGRAFPEECCGLLVGQWGRTKTAVEARPMRNAAATDRHVRYELDPLEFLRADVEIRERNLEVIGFYHSHPNHPPRPSATDQAKAAWPGYSYVIISTADRKPRVLRSWVQRQEGGPLRPESLSITP